jgi:hypothetical protein
MLSLAGGISLALASDHSDAPPGAAGLRPDANITDFHAFVVGPNLVLALATNPAIPPTAASYVFPTDVTFEFHLDTDSAVDSADPFGDGGTVVSPGRISEDITFRIRFRADGSVQIQRVVNGQRKSEPQIVNFFAGLRDDPFIRLPRQGRNSGALVLEVPLTSVVREQSTLLLWATAKVEEFEGVHQEIAGRSLRSMFPENACLNSVHPRQHLRQCSQRPDVMIYDTAQPAAYPNGRALTDDVVDLVCSLSSDCRVRNTEPVSPTTNDVPFLATFPYLAPPHPAP